MFGIDKSKYSQYYAQYLHSSFNILHATNTTLSYIFIQIIRRVSITYVMIGKVRVIVIWNSVVWRLL